MKGSFKGEAKALPVFSIVPLLIVLLTASVCYSAGTEDLTLLRIDSTRFMFLQVCSQCHEPERGYQVISDPGEWAATVSRMLVRGSGHITLEKVSQFAKVVKYSSDYHHYQKAFFEARCARCHDRDLMQALSEGITTWHDRTAALPQDTASWITDEEYELVLLGLRRKGSI